MNRHPLRRPPARASLGLLVALVILSALGLTPGSNRAQSPAPTVWSGEWVPFAEEKGQSAVWGLASTSGVLLSPVHDMGHTFLAVGALWEDDLATDALTLEVRISPDGQAWGEWQVLPPLEAAGPDGAPDVRATDLAFATGRYVQLRATVLDPDSRAPASAPLLKGLRLVAIDPGEYTPPLQAQSSSGPTIISRAGWGADESYMTWPPEYRPVTHFVVHHTATSNPTAESDPAGVVRTVFYYHAVTLGWGDIGYNYLVDRQGRIYEGRYGGDGVVAGHARPYNYGTVGVSILGTYSTDEVPQAALNGLVELLAWKCNLHFVHPQQSSFIYDGSFPNIMAHRDCNATTCPGDRAYAQMPWIRSATWERMRSIPPRVILSRPAAHEQVSGSYDVIWRTSAAASQVTLAVDGATKVTAPAAQGSAAWNTTTSADGTRTLRLTASTDLGQSAYAEVPVRIANGPPAAPPTGSFMAPALTREQTVLLDLSCQNCDSVQFGSGWEWEGEDLQHQTGRLALDPAAANGRAWMGMVVVDPAGLWHGPSLCGLPAGSYEAQYWLRCDPIGYADVVAELDVADGGGARVLAGPRAVRSNEFPNVGAYQLFRLPFTYGGEGSTCQGAGADGLELRTRYMNRTADVWLDRVQILTGAQPFSPQASYTLPPADGHHLVQVRYANAAGLVSPVYTGTVTLDRTAPRWGQPSAAGVPINDGLAGLAQGAYYATSSDGNSWGAWISVTVQVEADGLSGTIPAQPAWQGQAVRFKAHDLAGNEGVSPPILWPAAGDPQPEYVWWKGLGWRVYLPGVWR
ncbi:MAG: N-acetylmuramoyl-L-alanine amidase [Anaerolineae bacterium]